MLTAVQSSGQQEHSVGPELLPIRREVEDLLGIRCVAPDAPESCVSERKWLQRDHPEGLSC